MLAMLQDSAAAIGIEKLQENMSLKGPIPKIPQEIESRMIL